MNFVTTATYRVRTLVYHVKMCILADKYDIQVLKKQIEVAFSKQLLEGETDTTIAEAAAVAFGALVATHTICKSVVDMAVRHGLRSSIYDTAFGPIVAKCPDFAKDYAQALESRIKQMRAVGVKPRVGEKRYRCPGRCGRTVVMAYPTRMSAGLGYTHCMFCRAHFADRIWLDMVVNETWDDSDAL